MVYSSSLVLLSIAVRTVSAASINTDVVAVDSSLPALCSEIVRTPSSGLREHTCLIPAADGFESQDTTAIANGPSPGFSGTMTCSSSFTPPNAADATHRCSTLPSSVTINATQPGYCWCYGYTYNTAYYNMCNCNLCGSVTFTSIGADCQAFVDGCVASGTGGYRIAENPNMYTTMFECGTSHPTVPMHTACCTKV